MTSFTPLGGRHVLPTSLQSRVRWARGDAQRALELGTELHQAVGLQTVGNTRTFWKGLAELGALDLTVAGAAEGHLSALSMLEQARTFTPATVVPEHSTWGFLGLEHEGTDGTEETEGGGDTPRPDRAPLHAEQHTDGGWSLTGQTPAVPYAASLSHAVVEARSSERGLSFFSVALSGDGVSLTDGTSFTFGGADSTEVAAEDQYQARPGFALGSLGIAAVWWGAATALAQYLHVALADRAAEAPGTVDQFSLWHLGRCDSALFSAGSVLEQLATRADCPQTDNSTAPERAEALRVRSIVHDACETTLTSVLHALGQTPLAVDDDYSGRVSDLQFQLLKHRPEQDLATVGAAALDGMPTVWAGR